MKCIVLLATLCGVSLAFPREGLLVSTKVGQIRGLRDDKGYAKFLGIPYGKVGENVFGIATPHPAFDGVFEAYNGAISCPQVKDQVVIGTTDCLILNVYIPQNAESNQPLPVMIWMHGGAFVEGTSTSLAGDPHTLLSRGVIVVTVNYRVGVFGFMCLDIPEVPGNTGLKDQVLALRWIKENIEAFGGDANQITMFGESAGGMSTNLHLLSPHERFFDRAIIQSGPANSYWMMVEADTTIPIRLAEALGFHTADMNEALSFLMTADPLEVTRVSHSLVISNSDGTNQPLTKPCVEKKFEGAENFLTEHPMNIKSEKAISTPIIIGYNDIEFAFQYGRVEASFFDTYDFSQHFDMGFNKSEFGEISKALEVVNHFYIGDEKITENVRWEIVDFGSDFIFNHPTQRMAQKLMEDGAETIYSYVFSYDGRTWFGIEKSWSGATHAEELMYLFDLSVLREPDGVLPPEDQLIVDRLAELWTNFAKYGDPTPTTSELLPVKWTPITKTTMPYLDINLEMSFKNRPFHDRMAFWDLFYKKYGHYQKWYNAEQGSEAEEETGSEEDNASYRRLACPVIILLTFLHFIL